MTTFMEWLANNAAEGFARALDLSIKGSVVLLAAALAAWLARHRSAAARHALWSLAVGAVLALPVLELVLPKWELPVLPSAVTIDLTARIAPAPAATTPTVAAPAEHALPAPGTAGPAVEHSPVAHTATTTPAIAAAEPEIHDVRLELSGGEALALALLSRNDWVAIFWAVGAALVLLRIAIGTIGVWLISRRATPVLDGDWLALIARLARRLGVSRPVTLLRSDRASVPVTWGVVYPVVLLPSETRDWADERRAAVLLHELAHVRRFDALTQTVAQLALAVHWFNPLVWLAVRRMRAEREHACDDAVLGAGTRASAYAEDLIDIVRSLHREPGPAFAALAMARRSELEGRLLAILDPRQPRGALGGRSGAALCVLALLLVAPIAAMRPVPVEARTAKDTPAAQDSPPAVANAPAPGPAAARERAGGPPPASSYDMAVTAPSSNADAPARNAAPLPCRLNSLIRDDEPYSVARAEKMWFAGADDRCVGATYRGRVQLTDLRDDVRDLGPNGFLVIVEQRPSSRRRVEFVPEAGGGVRKTYYENARRTTIDGDARQWMSLVLHELFAGERPVAFAPTPGAEPAAPAAPSARAESSAPGAASPPASTAGGAPVLSGMTAEESRETLILAARSAANLTNDGDKARLLADVARRYTPNDSLRSAYLRAARSIVSDGSKRMALEALLRRDTLSPRVAVQMIGIARELVSEGDRSKVLLLTKQRASLADSATRRAYFRALGEIVSEGTRRQLLVDALGTGPVSREVAVATLRVAGTMVSGKERGDVLLTVAERAPMGDPDVRRAFFAALEGMSSDSDYRRVMAAVLR